MRDRSAAPGRRVPESADRPTDREHAERVRGARWAILFCVVAVLATVWWPVRSIDPGPLAAFLVLSAGLFWLSGVAILWPVWERVGFVLAAGVIAFLVAVTGGTASPYQDLFIVVPMIAAFLLGATGFAASVGLAILGAASPVLYEPVSRAFLADLVADLAVWIAVSAVIWRLVALRRADAARIRENDELKSLFIQSTSHELRTPITVIAGMADTLHQYGERLDPQRREDLVTRLRHHAHRLAALLADLLDMDRLLRGTVILSGRVEDLGGVVRDVVETAGVGRVDVSVSTEPAPVALERPLMERLVDSLVANAADPATRARHVWVSVRRLDGHAVLSVEDDGQGVSRQDRDRIFGLFEQGSEQARSPSPGLGLGLSLVSRVARLHGGWVRVEDRPGGGARFVVAFPLAHESVQQEGQP